MIAYRQRKRSDDLVDPSDFRHGLIIWIPDEDGKRQAYICVGSGGSVLPLKNYQEYRRAQAARNRAANPSTRRRPRRRIERYSFAW